MNNALFDEIAIGVLYRKILFYQIAVRKIICVKGHHIPRRAGQFGKILYKLCKFCPFVIAGDRLIKGQKLYPFVIWQARAILSTNDCNPVGIALIDKGHQCFQKVVFYQRPITDLFAPHQRQKKYHLRCSRLTGAFFPAHHQSQSF